MGASSTKEDVPREDQRRSAVENAEAEVDTESGSSPPRGGPTSSTPIDIPAMRGQPGDAKITPPIEAWVGSTNSPLDESGLRDFERDLPPLDEKHDQGNLDRSQLDGGGDSRIPGMRDGVAETGEPHLRRFTFKWSGQANSVAVAGSFNDWATIPMRCVGHHQYMIELDLKPIPHEYKYVVDGKWMHDPVAPVVASGLGSLNNILTIGDTEKRTSEGLDDFDTTSDGGAPFGPSTPPGEYCQTIPTFDNANVPLLLPPHLKEATLNSEPLRNDPSELPVPNHVVLDHLYAQSVKDGVLVLGATQRYRRKYITTVLHKPL